MGILGCPIETIARAINQEHLKISKMTNKWNARGLDRIKCKKFSRNR